MSWIAVGLIGAGLVGAVGSNMAASKQAAGQESAVQTQAQMFNLINSQEQPFLQSGYKANTALNQLMGFEPGTPGGQLPNGYLLQPFNPTQEQMNNYPGYQFALQTGGQATRNADTPGMGALSGAALKDLTSFDVGTANQYYGQYFNQYQQQQNNIFDRLSSIASLGQSAATQVGNTGTQLGSGMAQAQAAIGASQAAGIVGATNALSGSANTLAGMMYLNAGQNGGFNSATTQIPSTQLTSPYLNGSDPYLAYAGGSTG